MTSLVARLTALSVLAIFTMSAPAQARWSSWLTSSEYQAFFNYQVARRFYPRIVQARVMGGTVRFRGKFERYPIGPFSFYSHHGMGDQAFWTKHGQYLSRGFTQISQSRIVFRGRVYNQGTWARW